MIPHVSEAVGKQELSVFESINCYNFLEDNWVIYKNVKCVCPLTQQFHFWEEMPSQVI